MSGESTWTIQSQVTRVLALACPALRHYVTTDADFKKLGLESCLLGWLKLIWVVQTLCNVASPPPPPKVRGVRNKPGLAMAKHLVCASILALLELQVCLHLGLRCERIQAPRPISDGGGGRLAWACWLRRAQGPGTEGQLPLMPRDPRQLAKLVVELAVALTERVVSLAELSGEGRCELPPCRLDMNEGPPCTSNACPLCPLRTEATGGRIGMPSSVPLRLGLIKRGLRGKLSAPVSEEVRAQRREVLNMAPHSSSASPLVPGVPTFRCRGVRLANRSQRHNSAMAASPKRLSAP